MNYHFLIRMDMKPFVCTRLSSGKISTSSLTEKWPKLYAGHIVAKTVHLKKNKQKKFESVMYC